MSQPSHEGISVSLADYEYPKVRLQWHPKLPTWDNNAVLADCHYPAPWMPTQPTVRPSVRVTSPLENNQTAAGHECKMMMMVLAHDKIQDKCTWIDFQVQNAR